MNKQCKINNCLESSFVLFFFEIYMKNVFNYLFRQLRYKKILLMIPFFEFILIIVSWVFLPFFYCFIMDYKGCQESNDCFPLHPNRSETMATLAGFTLINKKSAHNKFKLIKTVKI